MNNRKIFIMGLIHTEKAEQMNRSMYLIGKTLFQPRFVLIPIKKTKSWQFKGRSKKRIIA